MFVISLPGLIDQVGMNGVDIGLSQEVRETFHATWRKDAAKYDFLEGIVKLRRAGPASCLVRTRGSASIVH